MHGGCGSWMCERPTGNSQMPDQIVTFEQALEGTGPKRYLLLGNGFSIALQPNIFSYTSLYDRADFAKVPYANVIFDALATRDFEAVIKVLMSASKILSSYKGVPEAVILQLRTDADEIKKILVSAIAENHPDRPFEVTPEQYAACRNFLSHFSHIYTLNYDILLYWALMQDKVDNLKLSPDDGFRHPKDDPDAPYVSWQEAHSPTIHYLHGALHLFDAGAEIIKYTWSKTDIPLIEQIRTALDGDRYPLFVSEGDSRGKLEKVIHNAYLHKALRSFTAICNQVNASLFVFGHSLAQNDDHILKLIARGRISTVFVSIYGDPNSDANQWIIERALTLARDREKNNPQSALAVRFFGATSAEVWGAAPT